MKSAIAIMIQAIVLSATAATANNQKTIVIGESLSVKEQEAARYIESVDRNGYKFKALPSDEEIKKLRAKYKKAQDILKERESIKKQNCKLEVSIPDQKGISNLEFLSNDQQVSLKVAIADLTLVLDSKYQPTLPEEKLAYLGSISEAVILSSSIKLLENGERNLFSGGTFKEVQIQNRTIDAKSGEFERSEPIKLEMIYDNTGKLQIIRVRNSDSNMLCTAKF